MGLFGPPNIQKFKSERNIKSLRRALRYKDWEISREAAVALCEFKETEGFTFLREHLKDNESAFQAAIHLAEFGDKSGIHVLIESLTRTPSPSVGELLGKLKDPTAFEPLFNALTAWMKDNWYRGGGTDWTLPVALARAIVEIKGVAITRTILIADQPKVCSTVLPRMKHLDHALIIEETLCALRELQGSQLNTAVEALGDSAYAVPEILATPAIIEALLSLSPSLNSTSRQAIVKILASNPTESNIDRICDYVKDEERFVGREAIDYLTGYDHESVIKDPEEMVRRLEQFFYDPAVQWGVKRHLARCLDSAYRANWKPRNDFERALLLLEKFNWDAFDKLGPEAIPALIPGLRDEFHSQKCLQAIERNLKEHPDQISEEDLRNIAAIESITQRTDLTDRDGDYGEVVRTTYSTHGIQKLATEELKKRGLV